jgi:hypothetical protein
VTIAPILFTFCRVLNANDVSVLAVGGAWFDGPSCAFAGSYFGVSFHMFQMVTRCGFSLMLAERPSKLRIDGIDAPELCQNGGETSRLRADATRIWPAGGGDGSAFMTPMAEGWLASSAMALIWGRLMVREGQAWSLSLAPQCRAVCK